MPLNQTTFSTMIKERKSAKNERPGMLSIMPKIPEISIGSQVEGSVSVLFDRNIRDHLWRWSTGFDWSDRSDLNLPFHAVFGKPVHCPSSLHLCREFGKRKKKMGRAIPLSHSITSGIPTGLALRTYSQTLS